MKAISPVLPLRKSATQTAERSLGISRSKSAADDPLSLLCDMNDYYSRLKELVPSLPQNRSVSKMEILQHVIDYILDLQIALDSSASTVNPQPANPQQQQQQQPHPGQGAPRRAALALSAENKIISLCQTRNIPTDLTSDETIPR